ncbi:MAG: tail fiber domain-containing protein, partial [Steroidobacteraceae bacterium]
AGIEDSKVTGKEVFVTTSGQLGVKASAERYKTAIEPMDAKTDKLNQLRPVTFHLKAEPQGEVQYGLIAEEVAKIYPELVTHDEKGRIDGVRYDELAPMLLNELQKEHEHALAQDAQINELRSQLAEVHAALASLQPKDQLVARR